MSFLSPEELARLSSAESLFPSPIAGRSGFDKRYGTARTEGLIQLEAYGTADR